MKPQTLPLIALLLTLFTTLAMSSPSHAASSANMPTLSIRWGCGQCAHNDKVIALIQQIYAEEVRKQGRAISRKDVADVTITDFRQRPPAARALLGGFSGKDRLAISIRYRGKTYAASDSAVTIMNGMNSLCKTVAHSVFAQLAQHK